MNWNNPRSVESAIRRLTREIAEIDAYFYGGLENDDRVAYASMLERKRDDMVRSIVLQLHTAIESLLNSLILCYVLDVRRKHLPNRIRSKKGQALRKLMRSLGFDAKLNLATGLGILTPQKMEKLRTLNELRNKCSHNWILNTRVRRGRRRPQTKPPLLKYKQRDLHQASVLEDFSDEYGQVYAWIFERLLPYL